MTHDLHTTHEHMLCEDPQMSGLTPLSLQTQMGCWPDARCLKYCQTRLYELNGLGGHPSSVPIIERDEYEVQKSRFLSSCSYHSGVLPDVALVHDARCHVEDSCRIHSQVTECAFATWAVRLCANMALDCCEELQLRRSASFVVFAFSADGRI